MQVGRFEKVSFEQFREAMRGEYGTVYDEDIIKMYDAIELPTRATSGSAGYDFKATFEFGIPAGESMKIPTGIRVKEPLI